MSATIDALKNGSRSHRIYQIGDGEIVPSVSEVIGLLSKPFLVRWAWGLGRDGINYDSYVAKLARIGTLAHQFVFDYLLLGSAQATDKNGYSAEEIGVAENCFLSFLEWAKGRKIVPLLVDESLVSASAGFGGTPDIFALVDDIPILFDLKTGDDPSPENAIQLAAYDRLITGTRLDLPIPAQAAILNIPRAATESYSWKVIGPAELDREWRIFAALLAIAKIKRGGKFS